MDLNHRHRPYESPALPLSYAALMGISGAVSLHKLSMRSYMLPLPAINSKRKIYHGRFYFQGMSSICLQANPDETIFDRQVRS